MSKRGPVATSSDRMQALAFEPIGFIETCFKERFGTPRQPSLVPSSWGILRLRPELNLSVALEGLEGFSHVWLIFVFHQNKNKGVNAKVSPPRLGGQKTGLFATRTPHRPNPIGLSAVRLDRIENGTLYLSGVDLVDGTPILDIKPYLPSSDCLPLATGGWTDSRLERTITVVWSDGALNDLGRLVPTESARFRSLVREVLELDPRPGFYKGTAEKPNPYTDLYGFRLQNLNVIFRMVENQATIVEIEPWSVLP